MGAEPLFLREDLWAFGPELVSLAILCHHLTTSIKQEAFSSFYPLCPKMVPTVPGVPGLPGTQHTLPSSIHLQSWEENLPGITDGSGTASHGKGEKAHFLHLELIRECLKSRLRGVHQASATESILNRNPLS